MAAHCIATCPSRVRRRVITKAAPEPVVALVDPLVAHHAPSVVCGESDDVDMPDADLVDSSDDDSSNWDSDSDSDSESSGLHHKWHRRWADTPRQHTLSQYGIVRSVTLDPYVCDDNLDINMCVDSGVDIAVVDDAIDAIAAVTGPWDPDPAPQSLITIHITTNNS